MAITFVGQTASLGIHVMYNLVTGTVHSVKRWFSNSLFSQQRYFTHPHNDGWTCEKDETRLKWDKSFSMYTINIVCVGVIDIYSLPTLYRFLSSVS